MNDSPQFAAFRQSPVDVTGMRSRNRTFVLQLLWRARELSRAELSRRTGMSRSSVSSLVSELLDAGLVEETGTGESSGGRRPILLRFRDDACLIAGLDMGATHIACALTDLRGNVVAWRQTAFDARSNPLGALDECEALVDACLDARGLRRSALAGLGLAVPSPVDPRAPGRLAPMILPAWTGLDVHEALKDRFVLPVVIDNDANLGALAERWWGAGRGGDDLVFIKLGTGVGAGFILNGEVYRGAYGIAGELSHLSLGPQGPPCACGQRGCLVRLIGAGALHDRALQRLSNHPETVLRRDGLTVDALVRAAHAGDPLALELTRELSRDLGSGIIGLLNLMSPAIVVIGGQLSLLGDLLLEPLRTHVRQRTLWPNLGETPIVVSALGQRAIALGAATALLAEVLKNPELLPFASRWAPP
jgi:predicted NBD/HSP70 family sugar kinase